MTEEHIGSEDTKTRRIGKNRDDDHTVFIGSRPFMKVF